MEITEHTRRLALVLCIVLVQLAAPGRAAAYGWPVAPFHVQHPVRAAFGDPRIGPDGHGGTSHSIHFGVDVSAPNGTPVYATISGRIGRHPLHPKDVVTVTSGSVTFEYWHLVPTVSSGQAVAYRTVLGRIAAPWLHVHFAERHGSTYVNPLRQGALEPYRDTTRPSVGVLHVERRAGAYDLSVEGYDTPALPVPAPWSGKPVTPAVVEWRLGGVWHVAADFRSALPRCSFDTIYAAGTTQNHIPSVGRYRFVLTRGWRPAAGRYVLTVRVTDEAGNASTRSTAIRIP